MNIYIPAVGKKETIFIQPQIYATNCNMDNLFVTGAVDNEIEQSIYISLTLLIRQKIAIPSYMHIHFPGYGYYKSGVSASLGIYYSLYSYLTNMRLKHKYLMTGEIDIEGKVYGVGQIKEKEKAFNFSGCNYFIIPNENRKENLNERVYSVSDIYEVRNIINTLETRDEVK